MMIFVMNAILYVFHCVRKENDLLRYMFQVIDGCYLPVELVCMNGFAYVISTIDD